MNSETDTPSRVPARVRAVANTTKQPLDKILHFEVIYSTLTILPKLKFIGMVGYGEGLN